MKTTSDFEKQQAMDSGRITTLNRRNHRFTGAGGWLDFFIFENIIYIFLRDSLLNVFCFVLCFFLFCFFNLLRGVHRENNEGHSKRSNCRKHHNHVLSSYHYWRCMWLCLNVCGWVFVCIHQGVIWNYFWQWRSISFAIFLVLKKKKKKITLFYFGSSVLPSRFIFSLNKFVLLWKRACYCFYTAAALCSGDQRGVWAGEQKWNRVSLPVALIQDLATDDAGYQEKSESWAKFNVCCNNKKPICSAFLLQTVWCRAQQKTSWFSQ